MEKTLRGIAQYARKNYLSYWIILGIDTTISVVCSLIAYAVIHYMAHIPVSDWVFCQFVLVSLLGSVVGSLLFHTYRNTIRFSQARELWRVMCAVLFKSVCLLAVSFWVIPETSAFDKYRFSCLLLDGLLTLVALTVFRVSLIITYDLLLDWVNKEEHPYPYLWHRRGECGAEASSQGQFPLQGGRLLCLWQEQQPPPFGRSSHLLF